MTAAVPLELVPPLDDEPQQLPVVRALAAVMRDVRAVSKDDVHQSPQARFNFRGIDAVMNRVGPALRDHGIVVLPELVERHVDDVEVGKNRTPMRLVTLVVRFRFAGPLGDEVAVEVPGEAMDSGDKAHSKAMSVALRTALLQTLALPTDEPDPDQFGYQRSARAPAPDAPAQAAGSAQAFRTRALKPGATFAQLRALWGEASADGVLDERVPRADGRTVGTLGELIRELGDAARQREEEADLDRAEAATLDLARAEDEGRR